jgi:hypothetical protein
MQFAYTSNILKNKKIPEAPKPPTPTEGETSAPTGGETSAQEKVVPTVKEAEEIDCLRPGGKDFSTCVTLRDRKPITGNKSS